MAGGYGAAVPELDPTKFRRPGPKVTRTRHLYLANCGRSCGDTVPQLLQCLEATEVSVLGLHLGEGGVSYASFSDADAAERVKAYLESPSSSHSWRVKFAELEDEATDGGVLLPGSVASTKHVEVPGVHVVEDFISQSEADELLRQVDLKPWNTSIKRRVQHYGRAFDYAKLMIAAGAVPEMPDFCQSLVTRLESSELLPHAIDQLTVNEYEPGIGIAFHVDAHSAFEEGIAAVTLGSGIVMEFRKPDAASSGKVSMGKHHRMAPALPSSVEISKNVWLPPRSLLIIRGEARYAWLHGIAWRKTDCVDEGQHVGEDRKRAASEDGNTGAAAAEDWCRDEGETG